MEVSTLPLLVLLSPLCWSVLLVVSRGFSELISHTLSLYLILFVTPSLPPCLNFEIVCVC